jgi:hypothetical protein
MNREELMVLTATKTTRRTVRTPKKWRVTMSPAVEKNFGHFTAEERLKQATYLREIARQLEISAKVAMQDRKPRRRHPLKPLCRAKLARN